MSDLLPLRSRRPARPDPVVEAAAPPLASDAAEPSPALRAAPEEPPPPTPAPRPHGLVEGWTESSVWGWAIDPSAPHEPVSVELWDGEQLIVRLRADIYRPDIEVGGRPGAVCGFSLPLPQHLLTGARHVLHLRIAGQSEDMGNSPLVFDGGRPPIAWDDFVALLPKVEERAAQATSAAAMKELMGPVMGALGGLLPRYLDLAEQAGQDRGEAALDLAFSYSDRIGELLADMQRRYPRLSFPAFDKPEVSIVIPVYGKFAYTYQCLASILKALPRTSFEVIVVDDCSPDETIFTPTVASGVRYIRAARNGGFIASCNAGAAAARGRFLLFLNNDTEVKERWLDALRDTFDDQPEAGLVGSKLVFPDGSVQEAGGIIWRLGDGWNYGRGSQPDDPRISYLREVDYVSGASIMVPKALFDELGGFDTHYAPAYYEDTDLAFRIRKAGRKVFYQPLSALVHHEGITSGTDVKGTGAKRYQLVNGRKFFDRWRDVLSAHRLNGREPELEKERGVALRVLFIDETTPTPLEDAGSVAAVAHMRAMQKLGAKITFVPSDNMAHLGEVTEALQRIGVECLHAPWFWSVEEVIRKRGAEFDAVYLHRYVNAFKYAGVVRAAMPKAQIIYSVADLHHMRLEREAAVTGSAETAAKAAEMKARELTALGMADQVIVHSTHEGGYLSGIVPDGRLNVIPWIVPARPGPRGFADRHGIAFLGGYRHPPNVDAVEVFVREMMPHLRRLLPGVMFHVVGSHMPPSFHELAAPDVVLDGFVADLGGYLDQRRLTVAPLRYGAGVKGKVLESMARGVPCVASSIAAEGMGLTHGEDIAMANEPEAFAGAVAWLYQDEAVWSRVRQGGIDYIGRSCSEQAVVGRFAELFGRMRAG
ncbi:glycosyltransferase [Falsiroseomonas sp. CW058]|uniref:glycosyltransferase n=1 Tax=Falsiroseomonas sp. CW058 TaxID=3388664 RepID=UPI003D311978